jgi:excisionase family DNA binding protein
MVESLGVGPEFLRAEIAKGRLSAHDLGGEIRVSEKHLDEYLAKCLIGQVTRQTETPASAEQPWREVPTFAQRKAVRVSGNVETGARILMGEMRYPIVCDAMFFSDLLAAFADRGVVRAGTSFSGGEPGSVGAWIQERLGTKMNPTYAILGMLIAEGYAERPKRGCVRILPKIHRNGDPEGRQEAGRSIRALRVGNCLSPGVSIRDLIDDGRRG